MILKKLTASGFKSFADKIELDFDKGITAIVGPNGCGKSNVVDSIKWVLGEQSAKSLRGKQMLDVIFNGSTARQVMNMAQVDLTFDNTDGTLPTDQTEVVVSRRLYRSGESEYLLNKQVCRLKDIRELFLDTGVGVDAYSVIEQGRVDLLLQANPTDRRMIFEEAAGISKYKLRKKEAQRRLERVDQNLLRVQDIVEEVEKRLRSVKLAAGKARNYQTYAQRLKELRSRYALAEYHKLRTGGNELEQETATLSDRVTQIRTDLSAQETRSSESNVRIMELEKDISGAEGRLLTTTSQISAQEERIAAAQRRITDQNDLRTRAEERLAGFDDQVAALDAKLTEQQMASTAIEAEIQTTQADLARLQEEDRRLAHEQNEVQHRLEDEKAGIIDLLRRTSHLNNEISGLNLQHESLTSQKVRLDERDTTIANELAQALAKQVQLRERQQEIDQLIAEQTQKMEDTRARAEVVAADRLSISEQLAAAKEYRSGLESRRQVLAEMDRKHEGLLAGAREILEARDAATPESEDGTQSTSVRPFEYVRGAVGELFDADVSHASIVEAVLGHFEKYLVVTQRDLLLADEEKLAELSGPVRAFCLDVISPLIGGPDLSGQEGFVANLLDWVRYPEDCSRLARYLLGRTYVVETIEDARRMSALDPSGARFVTMNGVVWEADGRLGVGPLGSGTGLISRRSELRELARELGEVEQRITDLSERLTERASEVQHLEGVQQQLRTAVFDANAHRVEAKAQLSGVEDVIRQLSEERPIIAAEICGLVEQLSQMQTREAISRQQLAELETKSSASEQAIKELSARVEEVALLRTAASEDITRARVRSGELVQQRSSIAEALRGLRATQIQLHADRDKAGRDVEEAHERIAQSEKQIEDANTALATLKDEHENLRVLSYQLREERDSHRGIIEQCAAAARALRADLESTEADLHERQIKLQEIRVRLEDMVARISEELGVDLEAQYQTYEPQSEENWPAVEQEIDELRQKIERLGNVNIDAIEEQNQLETRLAFLTGQLDDLRSSEKQLHELIEKLNVESRQRFIDTFNAVREHFSVLFRKLFGGGKVELRLMDETDVLECGIEIIASPPGKEMQSISLLSGGERTMTTIALLFAVFRSRPSPFVLLDEVDAALDEANNVRFNSIIKEFSELSQFILITHSKRTMSIAQSMYGITMQEAGVSKRVSVRFEDERQQVA